jgi:hypothetical protein
MSLEEYNRCQKYNVFIGRLAPCLSDRLGWSQTSEQHVDGLVGKERSALARSKLNGPGSKR